MQLGDYMSINPVVNLQNPGIIQGQYPDSEAPPFRVYLHNGTFIDLNPDEADEVEQMVDSADGELGLEEPIPSPSPDDSN